MSTLVSLDPRFPISDSMSTDDPNHPLQLVKKARELQNQVSADTKYDPLGQREGFRNHFEHKGLAYTIITAVFIIAVTITVVYVVLDISRAFKTAILLFAVSIGFVFMAVVRLENDDNV